MPANTPVAPATIFTFQSQNVRVISKNGEPWFAAADVCRILGIANSRDAVSTLDDDERKTLTREDVDFLTVGNTDGQKLSKGGAQSIIMINESGLYALIFKSRKAEAKTFRKWVTTEVLPAIRKTGAYQAPQAPQPAQAIRLRRPPTSSVPIRTTLHKGATWYRLGDVGWQLGIDAYLLARRIPKSESALLEVCGTRYGWQRCWWASVAGVDAALHAFAHKPEAARVREYLRLPAALPAPQLPLTGLPDGRYLLVVESGLPHIRDIQGKAVVDNRFVWALRRNFKTLSEQMRLLTGEADECILDLQLHDLREVQP